MKHVVRITKDMPAKAYIWNWKTEINTVPANGPDNQIGLAGAVPVYSPLHSAKQNFIG